MRTDKVTIKYYNNTIDYQGYLYNIDPSIHEDFQKNLNCNPAIPVP